MAILQSIRLSSVGLGIFAVVTAGAISLTQATTSDRIKENQRQAQAKALYQIVPQTEIDNDLLDDTLPVQDETLLASLDENRAYIARREGQAHTVLLPAVAPDGYTGNIEMVVGIRANGSLAGVRVLAHKETPGLGDKVDLKKSDWVLSFDGKRLHGAEDPAWAVKKDGGQFDQFTGATITPRAVVGAVKQAILYFEANRERLLAPRAAGGKSAQAQKQAAAGTHRTERNIENIENNAHG